MMERLTGRNLPAPPAQQAESKRVMKSSFFTDRIGPLHSTTRAGRRGPTGGGASDVVANGRSINVHTLARTAAILLTLAMPPLVRGQTERGIPVTDPLVLARCGTCHTVDERGNMERVSWARATPEGWQAATKRMIGENGVSMTPIEARGIVKYLSTTHGLAPE